MTLELSLKTIQIKIITDPNEILQHVHKGISIPVLPEFNKYILKDFDTYNAKAIILEEECDENYFGNNVDKVVGIVIVYDDGTDTLFFGFCNVYDQDGHKIKNLIEALIEFAIKNGFKKIRGPINIPTMIFGWGFMVEGSKKDLFIGSPINPPIYQKIFLKKGFKKLFQEDRYDMPALKMDPHKDRKLIELGINTGNYKRDFLDTGDYEYDFCNPGKEGMIRDKEDFLDLFTNFMPPSARITPKSSDAYDTLVNFIFEFGADWMMWTVRHKKTKEMVACGYVIPDLFSRNKKGELNSISFHAWVVHPDHRRKYLAMFMYGMTSLKGKDRKTPHYITKGSWPVGAENIANGNAARKMGGKKDRSHLILEYEI